MTLVVNFFGGPGCGKSTLMAATYAGLKMRGVLAEMAPEFAKDLVWERRYAAMSCQEYVTGEQVWRIERLVMGGVEVVVTDSPILLGAVYAPPVSAEALGRTLFNAHSRTRSVNLWVRREKPYDPRGRRQSEESARDVDRQITAMLGHYGIRTETVSSTPEGRDRVIETVAREIREGRT